MTSRRNVLIGAAGAAGLAGAGAWWYSKQTPAPLPETPFTPDAAFPNRLRMPGGDGLYGIYDVAQNFTIVAKAVQEAIVPGKPTALLAYEIEANNKVWRNPLLRLKKGAAIKAKHWNALDETSIIHWHGLIVDSNNDGHPHYAVKGGETYDYNFAVPNRAATYWYHPHPHHLTGKQVYLGLGGLFIVEDDDSEALQKALDLKLGETDIPLVLHDRRLDAQGALVFNPTDEDKADGFLGEQVLVNWTPKPYFEAATRLYRFRILNASNARMYKLAFMNGKTTVPFQVIANDGGLLNSAQAASEVFLSPAERVEVLLDLRNAKVGDTLTLASVTFDPMEHEDGPPGAEKKDEKKDGAKDNKAAHAMHGAVKGDAKGDAKAEEKKDAGKEKEKDKPGIPEIGVAMDLLRIHVRRKQNYDKTVPAKLSTVTPIPANCGTARTIYLDHEKMVWRINGQTYTHEATPITVKKGAVEVWEIKNAAASMPHPFHIHGFQYQVLERRGSPEQQKKLAVNAQGLAVTDLGWKDTVLVWPGESVCIVIDFTHSFGGDQVYMLHCHNLEHEDQGMMLNLKVQA
ncbi:MAG: multicopper oxidase family protein [Burkholderiales bacterium]